MDVKLPKTGAGATPSRPVLT